MSTIRTILVTTDLSPYSAAALAYVRNFEGRRLRRVYLLHVVEKMPPIPVLHSVDLTFEDAERSIWEDREKQLKAFARRYAKRVPKRELALKRGNPAEEILAFAKQKKVDLILMSTHGRTGLTHALMGSVAEKVVRNAQCPVLTLKPKKSTR